jgi:membrane associated rhomboid family serine protease
MAHLLMNMLGLWNIGQALERMLGRRALLSLYLAAGLTGALASSAFVELRWSVGASTSLFGLMGALAVVHFRGRHHTPAHLLPSGDFWRNTVFINALLVIAAPNIDHLGHLGGLAGGALMALALDVRPYRSEERPRRRLTIAAALLTALHAAGLTVALTRPPEARRADLLRWTELVRAERVR